MVSGEIFLIRGIRRQGKCPRFSPPPLMAKTLYGRNSEIAVTILEGEEREIVVSVGGETREVMEGILERATFHSRVISKKIISPDASSSLKKIVEAYQRIPEEPSLAASLWGFIREQFDLICARG